MMRILKTTDLKKYYGSGDAMVRALDGVNLSVEEGEFAAIVGTSGSGKSTLLHMMGGLDRPTSGSVEVAGQKIFELTDDALTIFRRRKIGFVFQSFNLVPVLNVYENIVLPIELDGGRIDTAHVDRIIETLGLSEKIHNLPGQLSGGQPTARGNRESTGDQTGDSSGRRADRKPGQQNQFGCAGAAQGQRTKIQPDHRYDHAQRRNRANGRSDHSHRRRQNRR